VLYLLWHGRVDEAADILPLVCEGCVGDSAVLRLAQLVVSSLSFGYPGVVGRVRAELRPDLLPPQQSGIDAARTVLREAPLRVETVGLVFGALTVSAFAPGENGAWAEPPRPSIPESDLPVWRAFTLALQAELALRRGDLPAAAADAQQSLTDLGTDGWGAALGWPISILIYAASEAGDHAAAANHLAIPLPEGAFAGPFGLKYLLARGRYHLATGRVHAALNDFYACREAASRWELDLPELLPWRTELARAYQKLDRVRASAELVREQLNGLREDQHRLRGIALRILARTIEPGRRVTVLEEAVEHLRASGDRLETAHALTDLSVAWQHAGRVDLTRSTRHEAELLARECGTQIGPRRATANGPAAPAGAGPGGAAGPATLLSDAERLVAALAAKGYTNREVAHKLFLTVSTVEQHLTRVYRKLNVTKRRELPAWLRIGTFDDVAPGQIDDTGSS
jgi:DNA-binding NarL/FixJ family response regulator